MIMKNIFLFFAILAGIAVMTGCKKDQDGITLKAVIDQETKAYFGNTDRDLPYWDSNDEVNVAVFTAPSTQPTQSNQDQWAPPMSLGQKLLSSSNPISSIFGRITANG